MMNDNSLVLLDESILQNNLNDQVSYTDFFQAFGYTEKDRIFFRTFKDRNKTEEDNGQNLDVPFSRIDNILPELHRQNKEDRGIFFVVNGGGQKKAAVKIARAQFIDFDDFSFDEQIERLNGFPLEPSIIVKTRKSLHCYWLLKDGDIKGFSELQKRLIQYFGSDSSIKDESRVMRLYGFEHRKTEAPVMVTLIKFDPDLRYTQMQLHEVLPALIEKPAKKEKAQRPKDGERVKHGDRHKYIVSRIGEILDRLGDSADDESILALIETDFLNHCEQIESDDMNDFRKKYLQTIKKIRADHEAEENDPDFYKYAIKAWKEEHPGEVFNLVSRSWDEVRAAGRKAQEEGKDFNDSASKWHDLNLELTDKLKVRGSFRNYCIIAEGDSYLRDKVYYNALDGRVMLRGVRWDLSDHPIRDVDLGHIRKLISDQYGIDDEKKIKRAIDVAADKHKIHPIREMLSGLKWDGTSRLPDFLPRYLGAERSGYTTAVTRLLFNAAVKRVEDPGVKVDSCIVLADTKQGTGKSSICRFMALRDEWFCDSLGDLGDTKKAYEAIRGHWICELGEMIATRRTKDIESIKAYLSRTADDYREPYGIYPERRPRQCIFIGTSNKPQFLPDDKTGNRRFLPILCDGDRAERHPLDDEQETREYIKQCYAEAIAIGKTEGFSLVLDDRFADELNEIRDLSTPEDSMVGAVQEWLDKNDKINLVCTRLIWDKVFSQGQREPQQYELQHISDIMNLKIEGWERYRGKDGSGTSFRARFDNYGSQRAWARVSTSVSTAVSTAVSTGVSNVSRPVSDADQEGFLSVSDEDLEDLGIDF